MAMAARKEGQHPHKLARLDTPLLPANLIVQFQSEAGDTLGKHARYCSPAVHETNGFWRSSVPLVPEKQHCFLQPVARSLSVVGCPCSDI